MSKLIRSVKDFVEHFFPNTKYVTCTKCNGTGIVAEIEGTSEGRVSGLFEEKDTGDGRGE